MEVVWHLVLLAALGAPIPWLLVGRKPGAAAALFAWVALVATYPLVFSLGELPANAPASNDAFLFLWDLWWVKTALARGSSPLFCDFLFAPHGTTLVFHGLALTQALASLPFQVGVGGLAGLVLAYDAVVLGSFWLAGWATYRLALRLTAHRGASIVAGLAFTLQSLHFASTVRLHALAIEWLPLFLLALVNALERRRARDGLLLGLAFVGTFYASIEYAYFAALAAAGVAAGELARREAPRPDAAFWRGLGRVALGAAPALLLTAPFWLAFAQEIRLTHGALSQDAARLSPDLLDFVLPDARHSLLGGPVTRLREAIGLDPVPRAVAVSWVLGGLAVLGAVQAARRRDPRLLAWAAVGVAFGAFALGPEIRAFGDGTGLPGPYALVAAVLPFFEQARMPMRFGAVAQLALAMLAASALADCARRGDGRRRAAVVAVAAILVAFEGLRVPLETARPDVPAAYFQVAELSAPGAGALIDWPTGVGAAAEVEGLHQVVHQQKLVQDMPLFLPRAAKETRRTATGPAIRGLFHALLADERLDRASEEVRRAFALRQRRRLARLGVRHVVLRRAELPPEVYERGREHLQLLAPSSTFEDEDGFLASFLDP